MEQQNLNNPNNENINNNGQHGKTGGILICMLLSTVLLLYISLFTVFPIMQLTGLVALAIFCGCYSVILKKASFVPCVIVPGISVAAIFFISGYQGRFDSVTFACCMNLAFAVILSAVLNGCTVKKSSGGTTFVALSVTAAVYIAVLLLFVVYEMYGSIGLSSVQKAINEACAFVGKTFTDMSSVSVPFENAEQLEMYKDAIREMGKTMQAVFKLTFPSVFANFAMLTAALIYICYKPFVKLAGLEKECFEDRVWRFEVSYVSAILFEIVFFVYMILSFFSQNAVLNVAFMNLVSVLTVPFAYIGLRHIKGLLKKKLDSGFGAVAIIVTVTLCLMLLFGSSIFMLAALVGASSVTNKMLENRH